MRHLFQPNLIPLKPSTSNIEKPTANCSAFLFFHIFGCAEVVDNVCKKCIPMKNRILLFLFLALGAGNGFGQGDQPADVVAVAKAGYAAYLEKIPGGQESFYGFSSRDEFSRAEIGKPYQILTLSREFFTEPATAGRNYIIPANEWRVSLTVNHQSLVMITVAKMNGVLEVVGIGAAGLAGELNQFEKSHPSSDPGGTILRVYQLDCEFLLMNSPDDPGSLRGYFLNSANIAFDRAKDDFSWTLPEILSMVKSKLGNN
jgi:hypothetical protein